MDDRRRAPDKRSPVQPGKTSLIPFAILAIVGAGAAWTLLGDKESFSTDVPLSTSTEKSSVLPRSGDGSTLAQSARGQVATLFSADDYPPDAQMRDEQGTVGVELKIDKRGRVSRCDVVQSSSSKSLDSATCRILQQRARFTPALDSNGRPAEDTYTQRITWRLEG